MIGTNAKGGHNTSATACYPTGVCRFIAGILLRSWEHYLGEGAPVGGARTPVVTGQGLQVTQKSRTVQEEKFKKIDQHVEEIV